MCHCSQSAVAGSLVHSVGPTRAQHLHARTQVHRHIAACGVARTTVHACSCLLCYAALRCVHCACVQLKTITNTSRAFARGACRALHKRLLECIPKQLLRCGTARECTACDGRTVEIPNFGPSHPTSDSMISPPDDRPTEGAICDANGTTDSVQACRTHACMRQTPRDRSHPGVRPPAWIDRPYPVRNGVDRETGERACHANWKPSQSPGRAQSGTDGPQLIETIMQAASAQTSIRNPFSRVAQQSCHSRRRGSMRLSYDHSEGIAGGTAPAYSTP